jgi:hypothetical protein
MTTQVSFHECCHSMGLVPETFSVANGPNDCQYGEHYMDSGAYRTILKRTYMTKEQAVYILH